MVRACSPRGWVVGGNGSMVSVSPKESVRRDDSCTAVSRVVSPRENDPRCAVPLQDNDSARPISPGENDLARNLPAEKHVRRQLDAAESHISD